MVTTKQSYIIYYAIPKSIVRIVTDFSSYLTIIIVLLFCALLYSAEFLSCTTHYIRNLVLWLRFCMCFWLQNYNKLMVRNLHGIGSSYQHLAYNAWKVWSCFITLVKQFRCINRVYISCHQVYQSWRCMVYTYSMLCYPIHWMHAWVR